MKSKLLFLAGLVCIFLIACNKSDSSNDTNNPPAVARDWFKLKTVLFSSVTSVNNGFNDSTEIQIDSANNKIIVKEYWKTLYGTSLFGKDTTIETFTYNSNNNLVLYEQVDNYKDLHITRMEFVRDANGQVTKVLSQYKNGVMASSEGTVTYNKHGDTTFVTFVDSAHKHTSYYGDGQDYYEKALVNNRVVYFKKFPIKSANLSDTTTTYTYQYDAAGNLITETDQFGKLSGTRVYTYQYGSGQLNELRKFITNLSGDLFWFQRAQLFYFEKAINVHVDGVNVLQSMKKDNVDYLTFTNGFDAAGNLTSMMYTATTPLGSTSTITEQYKYRP